MRSAEKTIRGSAQGQFTLYFDTACFWNRTCFDSVKSIVDDFRHQTFHTTEAPHDENALEQASRFDQIRNRLPAGGSGDTAGDYLCHLTWLCISGLESVDKPTQYDLAIVCEAILSA